MISYLFQGFLLGIAYVAPIGMQNLYVINSSISNTKSKAYITALIIIFFDVTLALACFFGIGLLLENNLILKTIILGIGSLLVIYIGYSLIKSVPDMDKKVEINHSLSKVIVSSFLVTWANPQALIDGSLLLGGIKLTLTGANVNYFILGTALASIIWFLSLTTFGMIFKSKLNSNLLSLINKICGSIIILYGLKIGYSFIKIIL